MMLIKNALLVSAADINYETRDILIEDGRIKQIGENLSIDCEIIDAKGMMVTPGLIDPHCHVGIWEEGIGFEGNDTNEMTEPSTPHLRGIDSIYPLDEAFEAGLQNGVTAVSTGPGSANVIGGTFAMLKTYGATIDDMVIKEEVAMKMALGENPKRVYSGKKVSPSTRMASAAVMRTELRKAKEYHTKINNTNNDSEKPAFDPKLESLARVFDGLMVKIHAHRTDDIQTAIRIAKEFGLNYTIEHATESHLMVEQLVKDKVRVIIGPTWGNKSKYELRNKSFLTTGILEKAGVEFSIMTDAPVIPLSETKIQTGLMIREGLSELQAIKAMTIYAAKFNEVDDRIGSIEVGKDADIVVWDGNPFEIMTKPSYVFVDGVVRFQR